MTNDSSILSVDLAYKCYTDIGIALLQADGSAGLNCRFLVVEDERDPRPGDLARRLNDWGRRHGAELILIDGPQAWKDENNGLEHCRVAEKELHTPCKTGPPGQVKPRNYKPFVQFSIELYERLEELGWQRPQTAQQRPSSAIMEVFPYSAWRGLGLKPLPSKRRATSSDISERTAALEGLGMRFASSPGHDQLQAAVAGLAGSAYLRGDGFRLVGAPLFKRGGYWREGYILTTNGTG